MNRYVKGNEIRITAQFTNLSGVLVDPATVTFKLRVYPGSSLTYVHGVNAQLVKDTVGIYHVDVLANQEAKYRYRFEGSGTYNAAMEGEFITLHSVF